ncbi:MAG: alpha/beta hydrolase [Cellulosilyticum sp.]|nr:alpha/beta hydrolase [Cellulosilyticum sp.]
MKHYYKVFGNKPVGIVVEMGLGSCLSEWIPMVNQLKNHYGVLLYERAGINKSEQSINERTPINIASELHDLLDEVNHMEQLIFVAHSQGGLYAQQFCRLYPEMVKGLVLLDPLSAKDNKFKECLSDKEYKRSGVDKSSNFKIMRTMANLKMGFLAKKLLKNAPPFYYYKDYSQEEINDILGSCDKVIHADTALAEYQTAHVERIVSPLSSKENFPNIPLVLVTHSSELAIQENMQFGNNTREFAEKIEEMWQNIMKEYLTFSERSYWIQAQKSTHYIHLTEPKLVLEALIKISEL